MSNISPAFQKYKGAKIAVYGLSAETEKFLPKLNQCFQVIGLLDGYREDGMLYEKPIISIRQAVQEQVKLILVVARPGSCRVIAKRIGSLCKEHGIGLLDSRGKDLCDLQEAVYDLKHVPGVTRKELFQRASGMDAVSFDLFDTLVMRQVLFPSDVLELVDAKLKKRGICIQDFGRKRTESEKTLSQGKAPVLAEIYTYMTDRYSIEEITPEELARIEWEVDLELLVPREEMCTFVQEMIDLGKAVYLVTDTYYTECQIRQILERCGILDGLELLVSCEYQTGKTQQLFEHLKDRLAGRTCVHIGDDRKADEESARQHGIEACPILSGIELLEKVGYLGLWEHLEPLSNRVKAGMFTAKLFNSPFLFENPDRKLCVKSSFAVGYLFFAPVISDFVLWFDRKTREDQVANIWFGARDGYLIQKLYDELTGEKNSVYFLISRTAAVRAGVMEEADISYVEEMKFSGSVEEQLKKRFGITRPSGSAGERLLDYKEEILAKAEGYRANYKAYIEKLDLRPGDIAFFDFVAKGTSQMFLGRLVDHPLKGYYFLRLEETFQKKELLDIRSFYNKNDMGESAIFDNYYILETMLTSPMPSLEGFDENGEEIYAEETRAESDLRCFLEAQKGICHYFQTFLRICTDIDQQTDRNMDEVFLMLIHKLAILDEDFLRLVVEDPFFNRMTDLKDLI